MKQRYDQKAKRCVFAVGDKVLALLPVMSSPFQAKFAGPYTVTKKLSDHNYVLTIPDRRKNLRQCRANLLKPYHERPNAPPGGAVRAALSEHVLFPASLLAPSVAAQEQDEIRDPDDGVLRARLNNSETQFPMLFSNTTTQTPVLQHDNDVGDGLPIRHFCRVSQDKNKHVDTEVAYLLENGLAEQSLSTWASPCLLAAKPDGTRFCMHYRKLCRTV